MTPENQALVVAHESMIRKFARNFWRRYASDMDQDDIVGEAMIGLVGCANRFDPDVAQFSTYALNRINWILVEHAKKHRKCRVGGMARQAAGGSRWVEKPWTNVTLDDAPEIEASSDDARPDIPTEWWLTLVRRGVLTPEECLLYRRKLIGDQTSEIARDAGCTPAWIRMQLRSIRKRLTEFERKTDA